MTTEIATPMVDATLLEEGTLLRLVLNRPKGNVLTLEMMQALSQALEAHRGNRHVRFVFIRGAGNHFSFGASVEEHRNLILNSRKATHVHEHGSMQQFLVTEVAQG